MLDEVNTAMLRTQQKNDPADGISEINTSQLAMQKAVNQGQTDSMVRKHEDDQAYNAFLLSDYY